MKVIVFATDKLEKIVNYFISYDFNDITIFSQEENSLDLDYYRLNEIKVNVLKGFNQEKTVERLSKIKGSITERFLIVYSDDICNYDLDLILNQHFETQKTITAIQSKNKLIALACENEIYDYFSISNLFLNSVWV